MGKDKPHESSNALARQALEAIRKIEQEANEKKLLQLEGLKEAKAKIQERVVELLAQEDEIDKAIATITGGGRATSREAKSRTDLTGVRERVVRWMGGRPGEKFTAGQLQKEFAELKGQSVALFMRPALRAGQLQKEGALRGTVYFAPKTQG